MNREDILGYILIIFILGVILKIYFDSDTFNLKCIVSEVDGNKYCVRERNKIQLVADLLAHVTNDLKKLESTWHMYSRIVIETEKDVLASLKN